MGDFLVQLGRGEPIAVGAAALGFFAVLAALFAARAALLTPKPDPVAERLRRLTGGGSPFAAPAGPPSVLAAALSPISRIATPRDERELGRIRSKLNWAGYRGDRALIYYLSSRVLLSLGLGGIAGWILFVKPQPTQYAALLIVLSVTAGFYLPFLWLTGRVEERQRAINHGLPDALDLLVTCVEAGLGLEAAMTKVAEEIRLSAPILADELSQAALEIQAGMSRGDAFRRMANRTGIDEMRNLAAIMIQTQMFGTSVAQSLRVQSDSMRVRRMHLAEEKAAMVAVKLSFPLVFCILPSLFSVLMGPAVINIMRILMPTLQGAGD